MRQKKQRHFIVEAALKRAMKMLEIKIRNGPVFSVYLLFYDCFLSFSFSRSRVIGNVKRNCSSFRVIVATLSYYTLHVHISLEMNSNKSTH